MPEVADIPLGLSSGRLPSRATQSLTTAAPARPLPAGYVQLGVAKEIAPTLREFGLDPEPIIRAAGLDPSLFEDGTNLIPHRALGRLLALSVARTLCRHFGLLVGCRATILSLGLVGRLMLHSETFGDALRGLVAHLGVQDRVVVPSLDVAGDTAVFSHAVYQPGMESGDQITDGSIACAVNAIRALLGADWAPSEVLLPRGRPVDMEPYRRHFRAPVRFDQEMAALVFPSHCLEHRIAGADPLLRTMLEERISQLKGAQGCEFSDDIRRLLRVRLTGDRCSADDIAELLTIHRRTLSRRLKDGGAGYRGITNEIRFEIARQLLRDTEVPLGQIAAALDYSEASAFTRAFRRWSGETPTAWRARHRRDGQRSSPEPRGGSSQQLSGLGRTVDEEASDRGHRITLQPIPAQVAPRSVLCGT
ncbi:AraC family transcriptional regulator [Microvirga tunisiensis]|uniref:AraC family transcriptional regulator n=1 Tax=Microvirga tunisiensis TaxID=2108360 RepID=A0A5N7MX01_9HYPH|nr:AraC family transcriptional regulator [Microvirga tunisiensis]MPR10412.1 AraC family transcriptional regulator [Microvirga tunisiensis]MPR28596.1 AraC family transcriptional regulator [Microvirga tunisiensis]